MRSLWRHAHHARPQIPTLYAHNASVEFAATMKRTALLLAGAAIIASTAFAGDGNVHRNGRRIPGRYIVVLEAGADPAAVAATVRGIQGGRVHQSYDRGVKGFAVEISDAGAQALARDARVQFVEEDAT